MDSTAHSVERDSICTFKSSKGSLEAEPLLSPYTVASIQNYNSTQCHSDVESGCQNSENSSEVVTEEKVPTKTALIIFLLAIGVFVSYADGSLVLATYGPIASEFSALSDASWLPNSYNLAMSAVQPLTGKLGDVYGRKNVLLTSYALFAIGCVLTGVGNKWWQIIVGRVVAGIGGAGMSVMVSVLIIDLVPLIQVAAWRSYVNAVGTVGRSIGGPLGGLLADTIGWRWSFIGQGPLISLAIILVALRLPAQSPSSENDSSGDGASKLQRIDFFGAFTLGATITCFLAALSLGGQELPWLHPTVIGLLLGSILIGIVFVKYEVKYAVEPVFPPALVIRREVAAPYAILALQSGAQVADSSNTVAGLHLMPAVLGNTIGGVLAGWLIQRSGRYTSLLTLSTLFSSLSYILLLLTWHTGPVSLISSFSIFPGEFGLGITGATTFIALTASVSKKENSVATAGMFLAASIGWMVGIAMCSGVMNSCLAYILEEFELEKTIVKRVMEDVGSIKALPEDLKRIVAEAYVKSLEAAHGVSLGFSLLAFFVTLIVKEKPMK